MECFNGERFRAISFLRYPPTWAWNDAAPMRQQMERDLERGFENPKLLNSGLSLRACLPARPGSETAWQSPQIKTPLTASQNQVHPAPS